MICSIKFNPLESSVIAEFLCKDITNENSPSLIEPIIFAAMGKIYVNDIHCYAFHGCMEEESQIGTHYRIDVVVSTDFGAAASSDDLADTVDYVSITAIVTEVMRERAKLIEVILYKIQDRIFQEHITVNAVDIKIEKKNPPINANVYSVTVQLEANRKNWEARGND